MPASERAALDYKSLVQDDRIHAALYTDPHVLADELERIFHRGWVFVGHDSEIPGPGDFVTRTLGTEPVLMVRDRDGGVAVLVNRCMHRGTQLCTAARGQARTFTCPYHGWTYDLGGALLTIRSQYQRVVGEERSIRAVVRDWGLGHIEIDWSPGYQGPLEWLGNASGPSVDGLVAALEQRDGPETARRRLVEGPAQQGLAARTAPWLLLSRGLDRERVDAAGRTVSHVTDETTNRGYWRHDRRVMSEA